MSEYQYYEFQAIDRPSARRIPGASGFVDAGADYGHELHELVRMGDFKGDPARLMERWFDLHLYRRIGARAG